MLLAQRLLAVLVIAVPGLLSAYGWNIMRDALFYSFASTDTPFPTLKFIAGLFLFLLGIAFIAGWFVHRDKKKK